MPRAFPEPAASTSTRLYVRNLPHDANEAILRMAFSQNGRKVTHVEIVLDTRTGRSNRFGFVDMASASDAQAAIRALNGTDLDGRELDIATTDPRGGRAR